MYYSYDDLKSNYRLVLAGAGLLGIEAFLAGCQTGRQQPPAGYTTVHSNAHSQNQTVVEQPIPIIITAVPDSDSAQNSQTPQPADERTIDSIAGEAETAHVSSEIIAEQSYENTTAAEARIEELPAQSPSWYNSPEQVNLYGFYFAGAMTIVLLAGARICQNDVRNAVKTYLQKAKKLLSESWSLYTGNSNKDGRKSSETTEDAAPETNSTKIQIEQSIKPLTDLVKKIDAKLDAEKAEKTGGTSIADDVTNSFNDLEHPSQPPKN
ncbi:MAG: hypothetical protein HY363_02245 [Candidatus Aenigmarchaeota archaeon]|nr:hypothetical protein [Candidatus Aenigmarchaeota archaeon]